MSVNVVLDIDGTLASTQAHSVAQVAFFQTHGAVFKTLVKTYYIFPGVIELIQLLFQTPNLRVSFFSAGTEARNVPFVENLLTHALGPSKYAEIRYQVSVLSRHDLTPSEEEAKKKHSASFGLQVGTHFKDLSKTLRAGESLENTIIVENEETYIAPGQARNWLYVPTIETIDFIETPPPEDPSEFDLPVNRICYVAGLLFRALRESQSQNLSVSEALFYLQFRQTQEQGIYRFDKRMLYADDIYREGLEHLRKVNPHLQFVTHASYTRLREKPISEEKFDELMELLRT